MTDDKHDTGFEHTIFDLYQTIEADHVSIDGQSDLAPDGDAALPGIDPEYAEFDKLENFERKSQYPLYLRMHSASPNRINRSVLNAVKHDNFGLLKQLLADVGIAYVLRHCMFLAEDRIDEQPRNRFNTVVTATSSGTIEEEDEEIEGGGDVCEDNPASVHSLDSQSGRQPPAPAVSPNIVIVGRTLFFLASFHGAHRSMRILADACLKHFSQRYNGDQIEAKRALIYLLNAPTQNGGLALLMAAYCNHGATVSVLLEYGVDPNLTNVHGATAAIAAASQNSTDALRALGNHPATDFNLQDNGGTSPVLALACSASLDCLDSLKFLYEYQRSGDRLVDFTATNRAGYGCAALAARHNRSHVISYLSSIHRANDCALPPDINQRVASLPVDDHGNDQISDQLDPPIHIASRFGSLEAVLEFLASPVCDVAARSVHGRNVLHVAVAENAIPVVRCFARDLPPDKFELLDAEDVTGMTPLYMACKEGCYEIVDILAPLSNTDAMCIVEDDERIENAKRADNEHVSAVEETRGANRTKSRPPLLAAVINNKANCARILLSHGVDVNQSDDEGHTALNVAAKHGFLDLTRLLLANGANPHLVSHRGGKTPLQKARKFRHSEVAELLEKYDAH